MDERFGIARRRRVRSELGQFGFDAGVGGNVHVGGEVGRWHDGGVWGKLARYLAGGGGEES